MSERPLRLGPLGPPGVTIVRSAIRWLKPDGYSCRASEIVAFCSIGLRGAAGTPFAEEVLDLHAALAPRAAGRIRAAAEPWDGGFLDRAPVAMWDAATIWAQFDGPADGGDDARLLFLAGRRFVDFAEQRAGLLTGWHDRARAWWGDDAPATLIGCGICEQRVVLGGRDGDFAELFERSAGSAQILLTQDEPQVPCARTLLEGLDRTPEDRAAIRADMAATFPAAGPPPAPADWLFMGALLNALERTPLTEEHDVLTATRLIRSLPPPAVLLSITAELPRALRHRRLGYTLNCHAFRLRGVGPAVRAWLTTNFAPVARSPEVAREDYRALLARLTGRALFVINAVSTHHLEEITDYSALDDATLAALGPLRAKAMNLMLHDLAAQHDLTIVDADSIAAGLGLAIHLRDGVHGSGALNDAIREEVRRALVAHGFEGFA